jgi:iron(III) transport system permease protein
MVALAVLFSLMALLPLGFIIAIGIETGWETIKALVFRPRVAELLSNTLWLTALAVPLCIVTGVAIAWLTERTQLAGRGSGPHWRSPRWRSPRLCKAMPG